jgi:hypothetical protein
MAKKDKKAKKTLHGAIYHSIKAVGKAIGKSVKFVARHV